MVLFGKDKFLNYYFLVAEPRILKILIFSTKKRVIYQIIDIIFNPVFRIIKRISLSRMAGGHFSRILLIIWNIK